MGHKESWPCSTVMRCTSGATGYTFLEGSYSEGENSQSHGSCKRLGFLDLRNKMAGANIAAEILRHLRTIPWFYFSHQFQVSFAL